MLSDGGFSSTVNTLFQNRLKSRADCLTYRFQNSLAFLKFKFELFLTVLQTTVDASDGCNFGWDKRSVTSLTRPVNRNVVVGYVAERCVGLFAKINQKIKTFIFVNLWVQISSKKLTNIIATNITRTRLYFIKAFFVSGEGKLLHWFLFFRRIKLFHQLCNFTGIF